METPQALGYRWPAEWEPHAATWIAWPHNVDTWPGHFDPIPFLFADVIRTLARYEPVCVLAGGQEVMPQAEATVGGLDNVTLYDIPTDDAWIRDYGPTFLLSANRNQVAAVDWQFNSWGGKYPPWDRDDAATQAIAERLVIRRFAAGAVLEGGSIDGNGRGTVLTTESCLFDQNRNPGFDRRSAERLLHQYLGATEVIWVPGGALAGDDTDGHIDQLARFVSEDHVIAALEDDQQDENYEPLQANLQMLRAYRGPQNKPLNITTLPMPRPIYFGQQRVPASYCNFYIANNCVLVPLYENNTDENNTDKGNTDEEVMRILCSLFPGRDVIGIPAGDLVWGLGALHCMTQQEPRGNEDVEE